MRGGSKARPASFNGDFKTPLRSILTVDVDDARFRAFNAAFEKYRDALDKMPQAWRAVNKEVLPHEHLMKGILAATAAQTEQLRHSTEAQKQLGRATENTERHMGHLWRHMRNFAHEARDATRELLKWSTVVEGVGGLLGAGGLWGISRLAQGATSGYQRATGLGTTWGGMGGFTTAYGRFGDAQGLLGNVMTGLTNRTSDQYRALIGLGFTPAMLATMDPAQVAAAASERLGNWAQGVRREDLGTQAGVRGYLSLADIGTIQNLRDRPEERAEARRNFEQLKQEAELRRQDLKLWADLNYTLDAAKLKLDSALIQGLTRLTPGLDKLVDAFSKVVTTFLKSDTVAEWAEKVSDALKEFAKYLDSPKFKQDAEWLTRSLGEVARGLLEFGKHVWHAIEWINRAIGGPAEGEIGSVPQHYRRHGDPFGFGPARAGQEHSFIGNAIERARETVSGWLSGHTGAQRAPPGTFNDRLSAAVHFFENRGLTEEQAVGLVGRMSAESEGLNPYAINPKSGAFGLAQWLGDRLPAAAETLKDPNPFYAQLQLAWKELTGKESVALEMIRHSHSAYEAGLAAEGFERAGDPAFTEKAARIADELQKVFRSEETKRRQAPQAGTSQKLGYNTAPAVRIVVDNRTGGQIATLNSMLTSSV